MLEFFAQGESGQPQPARGFCLIAFCQRDGLREDFAFGLSEYAGMSVVQLAFLRTRQQITGEGSEGMASRGVFGTAGGKVWRTASALMESPRAASNRRRIMFSNSRTFPGHECDSIQVGVAVTEDVPIQIQGSGHVTPFATSPSKAGWTENWNARFSMKVTS